MNRLNTIWAHRNECTMVLATKLKGRLRLVRLNSQPTFQQFLECVQTFNGDIDKSNVVVRGNEYIITIK